MIKHIIPVVIS